MFPLRPRVGYRHWLADRLLGRQLVRPEEISQHVEFECDYFGLRYKGTTANLVDAFVVYYGAYEKPQLFFLRDVLSAEKDKQSVFWDVGANTGLYTGFVSRLVKQVHAFEPFPEMLSRLRRLLSENSLTNVVLHDVGLGDVTTQLPFFPPRDENTGSGSFVEGWEGRRSDAIELAVVAADEYMSDSTAPTEIKLDVEGFTKQALTGMRATLERARPRVLLEVDVGTAPHEFASLDDLAALFPERYSFVRFAYANQRTGDYELAPLSLKLRQGSQLTVVAAPEEAWEALPKSNVHRD